MRFSIFLGFVAVAMPALASSSILFAIDNQGNIWRTGQNLDVPLTANAFQKTQAATTCATQQISPFDAPTAVPCPHAFVVKQDPAGHILYATYLGGSSLDAGVAITTDSAGNAYVTGYTYSTDFPVTQNAFRKTNQGPTKVRTFIDNLGPFGPAGFLPGGDVFIAKFTAGGVLAGSTLLGGAGHDYPTAIRADLSFVEVSGVTASTDFTVTPNALTHQGSPSNFFVRMDSAGSAIQYSTYSDASIQAFDDDRESIYFTGVAPPGGAYVEQVDLVSGVIGYFANLPALNPKIAGGGVAISVDLASHRATVAVSPAPSSSSVISAPAAFHPGASFLLTLPADGSKILAETDIGNTQFQQILPDASGNVYAFGHGTGTLPASPTTPLLAQSCSTDAQFVIELNPAGSVAAASYFRQGGLPALVTAPSQLTLYRELSNTMLPVSLTSAPATDFSCLANIASGSASPGIAPGELFVVFGRGLGPAQFVSGAPDSSGKFPTTLGGVTVTINGIAAPLLMAQAGEIHGVIPFGVSGGDATVQVQSAGVNAAPLDVPVNYNPGIFSVNGQAAVLNQDGTVNSPSNPAKLGSIVSIFGTGTGTVSPGLADGTLTPLPSPYYLLVNPPQVTFAGFATFVIPYAGAAPTLIAGVTQINAQLPSTLPAGTNPAAVPVGWISPGVFSAANPTISTIP